MRDLNRLVDPATGWFIHAAYSINDSGKIVALGCKDGQYGAVLLTPLRVHGHGEGPAPQDEPAASDVNPPCPYG